MSTVHTHIANDSRRFINHHLTTATLDIDVDLPTGCASYWSSWPEFGTVYHRKGIVGRNGLETPSNVGRRINFQNKIEFHMKKHTEGPSSPRPPSIFVQMKHDPISMLSRSPAIFKTYCYTYSETHHFTYINPEDGGSMYILNVDNTATIKKETDYKSFLYQPTDNFILIFNYLDKPTQ
jgi:hypothetical protein